MARINVYKLIEVKELLKYSKELALFLFELPKSKTDYFFEISPVSGWINYANYAELRKIKTAYILPISEREVIKHIQNYFKAIGQSLNRNPNFKKLNPYPDYLEVDKPVEVSPVINAETQVVDHWLCVYHVKLPGENGLIPLIGSSITFRIGNGGKIIGCSIKYRKIFNSFKEDIIEYVNKEKSHSHGSETYKKIEPVLCYKLGGQDEHQNILAPFYLLANGHHFNFAPASKYSIRISIYEIHSESGAELYAQVNGGSGKYFYEWSSWQIGDLESSFTNLGNRNHCKIGTGVYNVIITVVDQENPNLEIIAQTQKTIYARGESNEIQNINKSEIVA